MSALRPLVLVYQELEGVSAAADEPVLETLIMGPCYHIRDYPADRENIELSEYGEEGSDCDVTGSSETRPSSGSDVVVMSGPPDNAIGAQLDHDSVDVYLEDTVVELVHGTEGAFGETADQDTRFTTTDVDFGEEGVRPGDTLVVTTTTGNTYEKVITEVGGYDGSSLAPLSLEVSSIFTDSDPADLLWRVERPLEAEELTLPEDNLEVTGNDITVTGGVELMVEVDGMEEPVPVNYTRMFMEYRSLRQDLASITSVNSNNLEDTLGIVDERNPLAVGAFIALENTTTDIQVFGVTGDNLNGQMDRAQAYNQAALQLESRDDVYALVPLTEEMDRIDGLHDHAKKFSDPERAKFRTVIAQGTELPDTKTISGPNNSGTTEEVASRPVSVMAFVSEELEGDDVREDDIVFIVENETNAAEIGPSPIEKVYDDQRLYVPFLDNFITEGQTAIHFYVLRGEGITEETLTGVEVDGADSVSVSTGESSEEHEGMVLKLTDSTVNDSNSPVGDNHYFITSVDEATDTYTVIGPDLSAETGLTAEVVQPQTASDPEEKSTLTFRKTFSRVKDVDATFTTNGVIAGDILQVPVPAEEGAEDFDQELYEATIEEVASENRIVLEESSDIPTVTVFDPQEDTLGYRVERSLDREGQKEELLGVVDPQTGYNSKRLILVWPDEILLSSVTNNKQGSRSRQPGYYLACAIGGMSAGLPPQQGFTYLGVSGIEEIYHSSRFFQEDDLEELSNAGWYVFLQDQTGTTPYCLHQLTTDVSDIRNMEFSIVRSFDYVSRFYKGILEQFIGQYNVRDQTLDILRESLNNGTEQLKGESIPKIGAPLNDATIQSIEQLDGQKDRVDISMDLDLPVPLNRIGLRLTA